MKRFLVLGLALFLGACTSWQNPVTQSRMDFLDSAWGAALAVTNGYVDSCRNRLLPPSCRPIVQKIQVAAVPVQAAIVQARAFAKNPSISSTDLITAAQGALDNYKALQAKYGVQ